MALELASAATAELDERETDERSQEELNKERYLGDLQRAFQTMYRKAHLELGAASSKDMREKKEQMSYINWSNEDEVTGWISFLNKTSDTAQQMHQRLMDDMLGLYNEKPRAITMSGLRKWDTWFRDPTVDYLTKEKFIKTKLGDRMANWRSVAKDRQELLDTAKRQGIDVKAYPEFAQLFNEDQFLNMDYKERLSLVKRAQTLLVFKKVGMEESWKEIRNELVPLTIGPKRCLHPSKIGRWIEGIAKECKTPEQVTLYFKNVFPKIAARWQDARDRFDEIQKPGVMPRGFKIVSEAKFLSWHYDERMSYLEVAEGSEIPTPLLDKQKREIRYDLSVKDWEGAEEGLASMLKEYPDDKELLSMQWYIESHKPKEKDEDKKKKDEADFDAINLPQKHLDRIHELLGHATPSLARIYRMALFKGSKTLRRTNQLLYNRVWVRERGYSNDKDEILHAKSDMNKERTKEYVDDGHTRQFERNVIDGETATSEAVRDECRSPQALYVSSTNFEPVMEKIHENRDDENFGYWTTAFLTDVDYDAQASSVKNLQRPILNELRALEKLGYSYTDLSTLTLKESDARKRDVHAAETSYATAA